MKKIKTYLKYTLFTILSILICLLLISTLYYFNIIGSKDYEKAIDSFEGTDKIVCKSLISCINDNSHYINEEFNIVFDYDMVQKYKKVFKEIFNKLGHIEHYKMMMNEEDNNG